MFKSVSFLWTFILCRVHFCTIWERRGSNTFIRTQRSGRGMWCNFTSYFQQGDFNEYLSAFFFFKYLEVEACLWNLSKFSFVFSSLLSMPLSSLAVVENNYKELRNKNFFKIILNMYNIYDHKKLIMLYIRGILMTISVTFEGRK